MQSMNQDSDLRQRPTEPCVTCKANRFWKRPTGGWVCNSCHPCLPGFNGQWYEIGEEEDEADKGVVGSANEEGAQ
jgi:ribosomal protein L37AE/L43A